MASPLVRNHRLSATIASGDTLDVRQFHAHGRMNELFEVGLVALSENADIPFEAVVGQPMSFVVQRDLGPNDTRTWTGLCSHIEQLAADERGLSTYQIVLVPTLWLLTQRRNHRMFQLQSELDIARKLLGEWGVSFEEKLTGTYKKRKYRVQYGETDYVFLKRMLEDAGVAFYFRADGGESVMVLHDAPHLNPQRSPPLPFRDNPAEATGEHATALRVGRKMRPGKYTVRDHDYRRPPSYPLKSTAKGGSGVEESLERFHYNPGAFLFESDKGEATPNADDRGKYRTDEREAAAMAERRLQAKRSAAKTISFDTNTVDLVPGSVVSFLDHPKSEVGPGKGFVVTGYSLTGHSNGSWTCGCEAASVEVPYRPPVTTPKPRVSGVESATVVGPAGEEIHVDEFGRVRVHFHWDRESKMNETSSCWIHVSQPWGGTGFGGTNLPRIGQEVLVDFLGGDPDRPIVVGRVYTNLQKTPYKLPDNKTQSGWQSRSSPGGGPSNYNEIMFEDKIGQELVRMQAEKDLDKLVKHDESVRIGHDRTKQVGHDDALTVGHDRTREVVHDEAVLVGNDQSITVGHDRARKVGNDETVAVGHDRTRAVGNNEAISVGKNRTKSIGANESLFVGANQSEQIGKNRSVKVGGNHSEKIKKSKSVKIGKAKNEMVTLASAETVGLSKALTVGAAYAVTVGGMMNTTVGISQSESVGKTKTVSVGDKIEITCGEASITLEKSGKIAIKGKEISVNGTQIVITSSGPAELNGATVKITGEPIDLN